MLTVGSLAEECGLELAAGAEGADREIRWVHISELEDPTRWLSGGELLLTTGIQLTTAAKQRRFVELLDDNGLAGLGFGIGFSAQARCRRRWSTRPPSRGLPLFEVPYEMPFIAITEYAFGSWSTSSTTSCSAPAQVHERLERLVLEGRGLDQVLGSIAAAVGGAALVLDGGGQRAGPPPAPGRARAPRSIDRSPPRWPAQDGSGQVAVLRSDGRRSCADRALAVPVSGRRDASPIAWLLVVSENGPLGAVRAADRAARRRWSSGWS